MSAISEIEILEILCRYDNLKSEQFFPLVPGILSGGEAARDFGKMIHSLARKGCITTKKVGETSRLWKVTAIGRQHLNDNSN